jgi:Ca2+-transporting ATPase
VKKTSLRGQKTTHFSGTSKLPSRPSSACKRTLKSDSVPPLQTIAWANTAANELIEIERRTGWKILLAQVQSSLVVLLIVVMIVSILLGEINDAAAVFAIIVLNTILGFWQDYQAEKSLAELKKLSVPEVLVHRDGDTQSVLAADLVPGDIVVLQTGYFVPADCRLVELHELAIDESALTGESTAVRKTVDAIEPSKLPIGDRTNLGFMGTMVVSGHALGVVFATGMNTQLGQIASSLQAVEAEPTPLQVRLKKLSRSLAGLAILIVALVFVAGLLAGKEPRLMLMTALSLAVAAVPEGLPAVATVALAIGARRMFKQNALIRQLPAVETLGSVSVICSDKTGTLTQNRMTVTILEVANHRVPLDSAETRPSPSHQSGKTDDSVASESSMQTTAVQWLMLSGCLCNDAQLQLQPQESPANKQSGSAAGPVAVGEPTEKALVEFAARFGLNQIDLQAAFPRTSEIAFSSERKRMTTLHGIDKPKAEQAIPALREKLTFERVAFVKGAVDSVLSQCRFVWVGDQPEPLDSDWRSRIETSSDELAALGTRVLAIAIRPVDQELPLEELEQELIFVGFVGLTDPPRREAKLAVDRCRTAGIRPIMITGDHPLTATSIARDLGISKNDSVVTGRELTEMPVDQLREKVRDVSVFARVAPADKLNIVEALQDNDEVVAMTGDGVNDAPALKQANIGVAMGINGTDVSKQAANMVLLDDNFATIVTAVEQGRIVYANVRKFVKYTMSSNAGEILVMTLGVLLGLPLPLLPLQILWINLVTDGLPGLALAVEPVEKNTMNRSPLSPNQRIFDRFMRLDVLRVGLLIGIASLAGGSLLSTPDPDQPDHWRTIIFCVLTFSQMGNAFACRSDEPIFGIGKSNLWLTAAVAMTCLLQIAVVYVPFLQTIFRTCPLSTLELLACLGSGFLVFGLIELLKIVFRPRV